MNKILQIQYSTLSCGVIMYILVDQVDKKQ